MAGELAVTAAQVASVYPDGQHGTEIVTMVAAATITAGLPVYQDSAGKANIADANGSGTLQFRGIALTGGGAGQGISVLKKGYIYGFTIGSTAYDAILYLSDTVGNIATSAGSTNIKVGRVVALTDHGTLTKVIYIEADWLRDWA